MNVMFVKILVVNANEFIVLFAYFTDIFMLMIDGHCKLSISVFDYEMILLNAATMDN